jgi:hypothetical protein
MKTIHFFKYLLVFWIIFISTYSFSQSVNWSKTFGGKYSEQLNCVTKTSNGFLIAGYCTDEDLSVQHLYYILTDADGNPVWEKRESSSISEFIIDCTTDSKNEMYLLGNSVKSEETGNDALFIKISPKGEILFEKKFPGGSKQTATSFVRNSNDDFFVTGSFENKSDRDKDVWLLKLDKKGQRAWQVFSSNRYNEDAANAIVITPEEDLVTAGWIQNFQTKNIDFYIIKFNKYGQKIWEKIYGTSDIEIANTIALTKNNEFIVAGIVKPENGKTDALIMKLDKNGNQLWQKKFGGNADDEISSVIAYNGCYVAIGSTTDIPTNDKQLWMLKISPDGELLGDFTLGNKLPDAGLKVISTENNSFLCAGTTESFGNGKSDGWLVCVPEKFENTPKPEIVNGKDTDGPVISIISPIPDEKGTVHVEANKPRQIVGKITDVSGILDITINGNKISTNAEGLFTANLAQTEPYAHIRAIDKLGNFSETNLYFSTGDKLEPLNAVISNVSNFRRVALVIGNGKYERAPLKNPVNDAKAIAEELKNLNFEVISLYNACYKEMKQGISNFGTSLAKDKNTIGLFYYAGHGISLRGKNYIVPVDEKIEKEADVEVYAIEMDDLMSNLEYAGNSMNIIILDACRNNPFSRGFRSVNSGGLAAANAPVGTFIAYATAPGSTAADGNGQNGLYTQELLKTLKIPNLRIEDVFKKVRTNVKEFSDGQQIPWENSALEGDFIFNLK